MHKHTLRISLSISAVLAVGCEPKPKNPMGMDFRDTYGPREPVITDPKALPPVLQGKPPLAYMIDYACTVRVMDVESKKVVMTHAAKAGEIVSVDTGSGVIVGTYKALPGPLDPKRQYGIYLEPK